MLGGMKNPLLSRCSSVVFGLAAFLITIPLASAQVTTGFNQTAAGTYDYNNSANWVDGDINGVWSNALTLTGTQTVTFGADTTLNATNGISLNFSHAGAFSTTLRADGTGPYVLTLGGDVFVNTASTSPNPIVLIGAFTGNQNLNLNLGGATRTFNVTSSGARNLSVRANIIGTNSTDGIVKIGAGTLTLEGVSSYTGNTSINGGTLVLGGAGAVAGSDFVVNSGASLNINNSGNGVADRTRAQSVTINSGSLSVVNHSGSLTSYNDTISGGIAVNGGATISITAPTGKHQQLTANSFTQNAGGTTLFRGTNLGVNTFESKTAASSNIVFTNAPVLSGSGDAGTPTVGIIAGAYGDTSPTGAGSGLVTYDATKGVRLLEASEYTATLADGEGNVSLAGVSGGVSGAPATFTLNGDATVQSLSLNTSGASGHAGIIVEGTGSLTIGSGTIFANQKATGTVTSADAILISKNLDFGAVEGKILVGTTTGLSNSITPAPLNISGAISGSAGITKGGTGNLTLSGTASNTYTGVTTIDAGNVLASKTGGAQAITGDLVINGGILFQNSNQIADAANVTVDGGSWRLAPSGSGGSAASEVVASVTINSGSVAQSSSGVNGGSLTVTNAFTLNGGTFTQINGYDSDLGSLTVNGGTIDLRAAQNTNGTVMTVNGDLTITNTASSIAQSGLDYTPISLRAGTTSAGAQLILKGNVVFNGNSTNGNSTVIDAQAGTNLGVVQLDGARTFTIGDGAASLDLKITAALTNNGITEGGIVKTGLGTLALTGVNTYTGATVIDQGRIVLADSGAINAGSALTVGAGAILDASSQGAYTFSTATTTTLGVGATGAGLIKAAAATFENASLTFDFGAAETLLAAYQVLDISGLGTGDFGSVTATGANISGTFNNDGSGNWTLTVAGYDLVFSQSLGTLTTGAIPEPSTVGAIVGALALVAAAGRRKRNR